MKTKHTPGPWYVQYMPDGNDFWVKSDYNNVVTYGTDIMADDFGEHVGYPREQRLADAKLIAAAPDMLEALKSCISVLKKEMAVKDRPHLVAPFHKAEQAIKKATE